MQVSQVCQVKSMSTAREYVTPWALSLRLMHDLVMQAVLSCTAWDKNNLMKKEKSFANPPIGSYRDYAKSSVCADICNTDEALDFTS